MHIVIGGAGGYLGRYLAKAFIDNGHRVTALIRNTTLPEMLVVHEKEIEIISFADNSAGRFALSEKDPVDLFLNCAVCYGRHGERLTEIASSNILFPIQMLDLAAQMRVKTFMNCATSINSSINSYTLSKYQFSEWGKFLARNNDFKFIDCVLEHFFGPFEDEATKFVAGLLHRLARNESPIKLTAGEQLRDFIYISDVVSAFLALLDHLAEIPDGYSAIPIGSSQPLRIKEVALELKQTLHSTSELQFGAVPYRNNEIMFSCADTTFLKAMGWAPKTSFSNGIKEIIEMERL